MNTKKNSQDAIAFLENIVGEKLSFASMIKNIRVCDNISQADFAKKLGISKQYLCDIEHGRKIVSARKAFEFATILRHSTKFFILLALQDELEKNNLPFDIDFNITPKKIANVSVKRMHHTASGNHR